MLKVKMRYFYHIHPIYSQKKYFQINASHPFFSSLHLHYHKTYTNLNILSIKILKILKIKEICIKYVNKEEKLEKNRAKNKLK